MLISTQNSHRKQSLKFWNKKSGPEVYLAPDNKPLKIGDSETLLDVALSNDVFLSHICEGMGSCTTCRVLIKKGDAGPRSEVEQDRATERKFRANERLACQVLPVEGLVFEIPEKTKKEFIED